MNKKIVKYLKFFIILASLLVHNIGIPLSVLAIEASPTPQATITETPFPTPEASETPTPSESPKLSPSPTGGILSPPPTETTTPIVTETPTPEPTETVSFGGETLPCLDETCLENNSSEEEQTANNIPANPPQNNNSSHQSNNQNNSVEVPENTQTNTSQNSAGVGTTTTAYANTGGNESSSNQGNSYIRSGDALAYANIINLVNSNLIDSSIDLYLLNEFTGELQTIDLNTVWRLVFETQANNSVTISNPVMGDYDQLFIINNNEANVINTVEIGANTGLNQNNNNDTAITETGNATALLNLINLVNAKLVGSRILISVINIDGSQLGDLILPRPELFTNSQYSNGSGNNNQGQNIAIISDEVTVTAASGNNLNSDNEMGSINSGESQAQSNNISYLNQSFIGGNQFILRINNLGIWSGNVYNWSAPGAVESAGSLSSLFIAQGLPFLGGEETLDFGGGTNFAYIQNQINVWANSGGNQSSNNGYSEINTGTASAIANVNNLININLNNSNWFYGIINIVGNWEGNAIYAYPDLTVAIRATENRIEAGNPVSFRIDYANKGHDAAKGVKLAIQLPQEGVYKGNSLGVPETGNQSLVTLDLGDVEARSEKTLMVYMETKTNYEAKAEGWIGKVSAAENEKEVVVKVKIWADDTESDISNNESSTRGTIVYFVSEPNNSGGDERQPEFEISAQNNVNDFVYPKDTVTFEIKVSNKGEGTASDSFLRHQIYDAQGNLIESVDIFIGQISAHKSGSVSFGMPMSFINKNGSYKSSSQMVGYAANGNTVTSNISETDFKVKVTEGLVKTVEAQGTVLQPQIQGMTDISPQVDKDPLAPYILLFCISSLWIIRQSDRWIQILKAHNL